MSIENIIKDREERAFKRIATGTYLGQKVKLTLEQDWLYFIGNKWKLKLELAGSRDYGYAPWLWLANWKFNRIIKKYGLKEQAING